jgi:hypothetical protein
MGIRRLRPGPESFGFGFLEGVVTVTTVGLKREKARSDLTLLRRRLAIALPLRLGRSAGSIGR